MHLVLGVLAAVLHPVADMVKPFKHDGIYIMVKCLLDNGFRHAVDLVFGEADFSCS